VFPSAKIMSNKKATGGNSHDRRNDRRQETEGVRNADTSKSKKTLRASPDGEATQRRNDLITLIGLALAFASWGWTVIAPESSVWFGSILLFAAFASALWALWRVWALRKGWFWLPAFAAIAVFTAFDWSVVVRPQRGEPFRDLLVEGYHLTNECESIPGTTQMPTWMRDQSKGWQS
jgi:hypothetical protein